MVKRYKTARNMSLCTEFFLVTVRSRFFYSLHEVNMPQVLRNDESQFSGNPVSKIPHKGSKITPKSSFKSIFVFHRFNFCFCRKYTTWKYFWDLFLCKFHALYNLRQALTLLKIAGKERLKHFRPKGIVYHELFTVSFFVNQNADLLISIISTMNPRNHLFVQSQQ